jgi:hypothetical protein
MRCEATSGGRQCVDSAGHSGPHSTGVGSWFGADGVERSLGYHMPEDYLLPEEQEQADRIASLSTALAESREREARLAEACQAAWDWMDANADRLPPHGEVEAVLLAALAGSREGERP